MTTIYTKQARFGHTWIVLFKRRGPVIRSETSGWTIVEEISAQCMDLTAE
jgi:hypothetical protein